MRMLVQQESIPVGCVPPAFLVSGGGGTVHTPGYPISQIPYAQKEHGTKYTQNDTRL